MNVPGSPVRTDKLQRSFLLAFLEKRTPAFRNDRLEAGLHKIVNSATDDRLPRYTQEVSGADAGVPILAIVVREQNGGGRMEYDRLEQQLQLLRTVFEEPAWSFGVRGGGAQN